MNKHANHWSRPRAAPAQTFDLLLPSRRKAGAPEGRPQSSPDLRHRLCAREADLPGSTPGATPHPQSQTGTCRPSDEDLHLVMWGKTVPQPDSGGSARWGRPCAGQGALPRPPLQRDYGPSFPPSQPRRPCRGS